MNFFLYVICCAHSLAALNSIEFLVLAGATPHVRWLAIFDAELNVMQRQKALYQYGSIKEIQREIYGDLDAALLKYGSNPHVRKVVPVLGAQLIQQTPKVVSSLFQENRSPSLQARL